MTNTLSPGQSPKSPTFSVIVPIYNALRYLDASLTSIVSAAEHHGNVEIIFVDNGSNDGSYEHISSVHKDHATIKQLPHITIGALRNAGAKTSSGKYVCFIDADCTIPQDYFHQAARVFATVECDATGSMYALPDPAHWIERAWQEMHERTEDGYVNYLNSGNLLVERSAFDSVNGFSETLVTGEDAEFCSRLRAANFRVYEAHAVRAVHLGNPKNLAWFFKKQLWHGMGAFGTWRLNAIDKPLLLTLFHVAAAVCGITFLFVGPLPVTFRAVILLASLCLAPVLATIYRCVPRGKISLIPYGIVLYFLYFSARAGSLLKLVLRR